MSTQRKKLVTSGVYASLLLAAAGASAAEQATGLYVTPSVGYQYFDSENFDQDLPVNGIENDVAYGLGLGYKAEGPWAGELKYEQTNTEFDVDSGDTADVNFKHWHLDGFYFFGNDKNWTPYLAAGLGDGKYEIDGVKDDHQTFANAGVGVVKALSKHVDLRTELRAQYSFDEEMTNALFNIGLVYNFGTAPAPKEEPAPAPAPAPVAPVDTDGDGVFDPQDQCPGTARGAKVDEKGCYIILNETKSFNLDVKFANASAALEPNYMGSVRDLATFLTQYPTTDVVIEGHSDSNGGDKYNQSLSERRAKAVADALVTQYGIDAGRVTSVGYGESRPVASNANEEGRRQNRRVVGVVKASVEKRAMQ